MAVAAKDSKKREHRARKTKPRAPQIPTIFDTDFGAGTTAGLTITQENALKYSAVYRAVSLISQTIGTLPIHARERKTVNGRPARVILDSGPAAMFVREPNAEQTPVMFFEQMCSNLLLWGNFYGEIVKAGPRWSVWPIPPNRVTVARSSIDGGLIYVIHDNVGNAVTLFPQQVVHVALMGDGIVGLSPISMAREAIGLGLATEQTGSALFKNGIMPSGVLTHPGELGTKALENLRKQKVDRHTASVEKRKVMILEEGMKWQQIAIQPNDAQFLETRVHQIQEIARFFGVPPHMLYDNSEAHFKTAPEQRSEYQQFTLRHLLVRIEQELSRKLAGIESGQFFKFDIVGLLRGDLKSQMDIMRKQYGMGAITSNEIRELWDLPSIGKEGDEYFIDVNLQSIKTATEPPPEPQPVAPPIPPDDGEDGDDSGDDSGLIDDAVRDWFRDTAGRVVRKEIIAIRRILKKGVDVDEALRSFYAKHEAYVVDTMGRNWLSLAKIRGGTEQVKKAASRYTNAARDMCLTALREQGAESLGRLMTIWDDNRADNVAVDWMEAGYVSND